MIKLNGLEISVLRDQERYDLIHWFVFHGWLILPELCKNANNRHEPWFVHYNV